MTAELSKQLLFLVVKITRTRLLADQGQIIFANTYRELETRSESFRSQKCNGTKGPVPKVQTEVNKTHIKYRYFTSVFWPWSASKTVSCTYGAKVTRCVQCKICKYQQVHYFLYKSGTNHYQYSNQYSYRERDKPMVRFIQKDSLLLAWSSCQSAN